MIRFVPVEMVDKSKPAIIVVKTFPVPFTTLKSCACYYSCQTEVYSNLCQTWWNQPLWGLTLVSASAARERNSQRVTLLRQTALSNNRPQEDLLTEWHPQSATLSWAMLKRATLSPVAHAERPPPSAEAGRHLLAEDVYWHCTECCYTLRPTCCNKYHAVFCDQHHSQHF